MNSYWPSWAGALGLAAVAISYTVATGRSFGVSGAWNRVVHWRTEREAERADEQFNATDQEAMAAAIIEQFGADPAGPPPGAMAGHTPAVGGSEPAVRTRPAPLVSQAVLLVSILFGGWLAAAVSGRFKVRFDMGDGFRQIVTDRPITMVALLFVGGILVGAGTNLAGGCSSGHGLSGCGRLQPVSILATSVFFGTAVLVSFLLWKVI